MKEEQMHKKLYCKCCREMAMFISHVQNSKKFICTQCRFVTTNLITEPKMPDRKNTAKETMDNFFNSLLNKQKEKPVMSWRSK